MLAHDLVETAALRGGVAALAAAAVFIAAACTAARPPADQRPVTALVGGRVFPSPEAPPIPDGVVLVEGTTIAAVGARREVRVPPHATVIDCSGGTVTAGFWNSHVHFTGPQFRTADSAPAESLTAALASMLTSYGLVHVVDTGSYLPNTMALRRRIESGEVPGPSILTAGSGFAPAGGSPYYILPAKIPELSRPEDAALVEAEIARGADLVKLFTGSFATPRSIVVMPVDVVRAAADVGHRHRKLVFAHPSNSPGARAAIEGGVDVLAHTFPTSLDGTPWDRALPGMMKDRGMALIPTLKLWPYELRRAGLPDSVVELVLDNGVAQTRTFAGLGGQLLFGTDVGYMTDYDPTDEFVYLQRAGLSATQILAMLTTAPATRFAAARAGRLASGFAADVVVLDGNPGDDVRAFAKVRLTMRDGRVIYQRPR
ncbi:MAG TPA: amidohydrolase family protein [Methylomirabilota bacterium]|nr:amidohydrolase family protein [Methylomirabilota bacterium]